MTANRKNIENGWLKCPYCGKKLFPVDERTDVRHLAVICKLCKKKVIISMESAAT